MNGDGTFKPFHANGEMYSTRGFMDRADRLARQGYLCADDPAQKRHRMDAMWYLRCGAQSPLFGKEGTATLQRAVIANPATHQLLESSHGDQRG